MLAVVESVDRAGGREAYHRRDQDADAGRSGRSGVRRAGACETVGTRTLNVRQPIRCRRVGNLMPYCQLYRA
jgi:hypothetical protein